MNLHCEQIDAALPPTVACDADRGQNLAEIAASAMTTEHCSARSAPTVEARPAGLYRWLAALFLALGGLSSWVFLADAGQEPQLWWLAFAVMVFPLFLVGALTAWWGHRSRIVADEDGLRWRSFGGWRRARWDEVQDYHHRLGSEGNPGWCEVETANGKLGFGPEHAKAPALREVISERATSALACSWGQKGLRVEDPWARTFGYEVRRDRPALYLSSALGLAFFTALFGWVVPNARSIAAEIGGTMTILQIITGLVVIAVPVFGLLLFSLQSVLDTHRRRRHTISVDPDGITFRADTHEITAPWSEVNGYFFGPPKGWVTQRGPAVILTRRGAFDFSPALKQEAQLRELIRRHATAASTSDWADEFKERLGDEGLCWTGGSPGVGQRVFHYRTQSNRAGLAFVGVWFLGSALSAAIGPLRDMTPDNPGYVFGMVGIAAAVFLWSFWRYRAAAILVDEYGVTQRAWNGARFLRWEEIAELCGEGLDSMDRATVKAKGGRIRFSLSVADAAELKDEIARRAVNAKDGWKK